MENPKKPLGPSTMTQQELREDKRQGHKEGTKEWLAEGLCELLARVEVTKYEHQTPYSGSDKPASYTLQTRHINGDKRRGFESGDTGCYSGGLDAKEQRNCSSRWSKALGSKAGRMGVQNKRAMRVKKNVAGSV